METIKWLDAMSIASPIRLKKAIAISCNSYFCNVFQIFFDKYQNTEIAFNTWKDHIASFGVGQWMNNDFSSGKKGFLPKTEFYDNIYGKTHWNASTVLSLSIGQGELLLTPIQMANITAIIANRGYYFTPHIVKQIGEENIRDEQFTKRNTLQLTPYILGVLLMECRWFWKMKKEQPKIVA